MFAISAAAQTTEFSYQGNLKDGGNPANGNYDFEFALYDNPMVGSPIGPTIQRNMVAVANGSFTVKLDFGSVFPGANRYLDVRVKPAGAGPFTPLVPRQAIGSSPYSITAGDATSPNIARLNVPNTAVTATGVPTVTSGFITGASVTSGGSGYVTPPTVTVIDMTGSGAVIVANISMGGVVTNLTVQNAGSGYSANASLSIAPPPNNASQTFVSQNVFTNANNTFTGNGSGLTSVNAAQLGGLPPSRYVQSDASGNVGIGTTSTGAKLAVAGVIESTTGGMKFPDNTTQATAGLVTVATNSTLSGNGTAASPLAVASGTDPATQPFQLQTNNVPLDFTVPAGKRLVVEFFYSSISGTIPSAPVQMVITNGAKNILLDQYVVTSYPGSGGTWYHNNRILVYVEPGDRIRFFPPGNSGYIMAATGHFVNVP